MPLRRHDRPVHLPPDGFGLRDIPRIRKGPAKWRRLHPSDRDPIYFSTSTANRFAAPGLGTLYLARNARSCLLEKYGDRIYAAVNHGEKSELSASDWRDRMLTIVGVPGITVCDLTSPATLAACGVDIGTLSNPDLRFPQAWAKAIMEHPNGFDGIQYSSRFTQGACLALFNRRPLKMKPLQAIPLSSHPEGLRLLSEFRIALV